MIRCCCEVLIVLKKYKYYKIFFVSVDSKKYGVLDYFDIIKNLMDMGMVKMKFDIKVYFNFVEFCVDMCLIFFNGFLYNGTALDVGVMIEIVC